MYIPWDAWGANAKTRRCSHCACDISKVSYKVLFLYSNFIQLYSSKKHLIHSWAHSDDLYKIYVATR